ncbi:hypothetical protein BBO_04459 [Beauveria brongniartii RCEF 3172]|uniref:Uncharacterized protein n=1 Tax=Beauveria brongniartii RCEF 3172 TaxID=1081107 RepID=A0A162JM95_9HYPO|nr:hypothetical protein BBO_04459 [Beauveria brongniartii RCEF 3172]
MRPQNTLVALLVGLTGPGVLAVPTFGLLCDAMNDAMNLMGGGGLAIPCGGSRSGGSKDTSRPSDQAMADAAEQWRADTGVVSNFLSNAESMTPQERQDQGQVAADAEKDELVQKAVLDRMFLNGTAAGRDPAVAAADDMLANQGTFQFVLDALILFSKRGSNLTDDEVSSMVTAVNQDRCTNVLPSIDTYLGAAQAVTRQGSGKMTAVRPTNC